MSLSASEQQALDSIEATLTSSDPELASQLAIFARLASGEEMPVRERVRMHRRLHVARGWQRKQRCSRPDKAGRRMRSGFRSLGWRREPWAGQEAALPSAGHSARYAQEHGRCGSCRSAEGLAPYRRMCTRAPRAAQIGAIRRRVRKGAKTNERKPPKGRS